jgi:hypothetical protein
MTTERNPEMGRNRSFERRAREEVERIKSEEAAEEERKQARMRELALQARERREAEAAEEERRKEERDAKFRRSQEEKAEVEERLAKDSARRSWKANAGVTIVIVETWFPRPEKPDPTYAEPGEGTVSWLRRSTLPLAGDCREFLNRNLAVLPEGCRQGIFNHLSYEQHHRTGFFELVVARALQELGADIECEPENPCLGTWVNRDSAKFIGNSSVGARVN